MILTLAGVSAVLALVELPHIRGQSKRSRLEEAIDNVGGFLCREVGFKVLCDALAVRGGDLQPVADKRLNGAYVGHQVGFDIADILNVFAALPEGFCGLPAQIIVDLAG